MRLYLPTIVIALPLLLQGQAPAMSAQKSVSRQESKQDADTQQTKKPPTKKTAKPEKPTWPRLKFSKKSTAKDKINLLVSGKPDVQAKARTKILSYGAGVAPVLLAAYHDRQKQGILDQLEPLLDQLITKEYGPVLEISTNPKNLVQTKFTLAKLDSFEDARYQSWFRKMTQVKDPEISDRAWYALARIGDAQALDFLIEKARKDWNKEKDLILPVLPGLKGDGATDKLLTLLAKKELADKLAALRLLNGVGTKKCQGKVAEYLNSGVNVLRVEAVNALLGIVDGKKPHDHLSVFESIEVVKKWKSRMGV